MLSHSKIISLSLLGLLALVLGATPTWAQTPSAAPTAISLSSFKAQPAREREFAAHSASHSYIWNPESIFAAIIGAIALSLCARGLWRFKRRN